MSNLSNLIDSLSSLTIMEAAELAKLLEEKWGVSAAAAVQVQGLGAANPSSEVAEEQTEFTVMLTNPGSDKIPVIKEIRAITGLGLKEAKELVDSSAKEPGLVKELVSKEDAEKIKAQLEKVGATVELK